MNKRGFTLIELMVVIAVIAISAAIGAPSLNRLIKNQPLKSSAVLLVQNLKRSRIEAIKSGSDTVVTFDSAAPLNGNYQITVNGASRTINIPDGVTMTENFIGSGTKFSPRGTTGLAGTVSLSNIYMTYNVRLSPTGIVRLEKVY